MSIHSGFAASILSNREYICLHPHPASTPNSPNNAQTTATRPSTPPQAHTYPHPKKKNLDHLDCRNDTEINISRKCRTANFRFVSGTGAKSPLDAFY